MSNFNYCNYIGEHMSEPLRVNAMGMWDEDMHKEPTTLELISVDYRSNSICVDILSGDHKGCETDVDFSDAFPLIKSPADLTDEELAYFLYGKELPPFAEVCRIATNVWIEETIFGVTETVFRLLDIKRMKLTQNQWNRLYSLHVYLDYEELIRARKAVRKI